MRRTPARVLSLLLALAGLFAAGPLLLGLRDAAAMDVTGNTYTSPTYGYTLTWDDSWEVRDEGSTGREDFVLLSNGIGLVALDAWTALFTSPQACASGYGDVMAEYESNADIRPMLDDDGAPLQGGDATRYYAAYTFTQTAQTGQTLELVAYTECRILIVDRAMLRIVAVTLVDFYEMQAPLVEELLAGLVIPSPGEPGPAFVAGVWRIAVVAAMRGERVYAAGLDGSEEGKDWLVVVADVTNWGSDEAMLAIDDFAIRFDKSDERSDLAVEEIPAVAATLGIEPTELEARVPFAAGETRRLPLVFQVPHAGIDPALVRANSALPLADVLGAGTHLQDLRPVVTPPPLQEARVIRVVDGATLKVTMVADDTTQTVTLMGLDAPLPDECYGEEAANRLARLAGDTVWLEEASAFPGVSGLERYVWTEKPNGSRVLLNRQLVAEGYAALGALYSSDRFAAWLAEAETTALAKERGLWGACSGPHAPT